MLAFGDIYRKNDLLTAMRRLLQVSMFPNMPQADKARVMEQLAWFDHRQGILDITCKFETLPEARTMRLTIEVSLRPETVQ